MTIIKISGIYKIENLENGKVYVGESLDITNRWEKHLKDLENNEHHSYKLQEDCNIYGVNNFDFEIIEIIELKNSTFKTKMTLVYLEDKYIKEYNSFDNGYNCEMTMEKILAGDKFICDENKDKYYLKYLMAHGLDYNVKENKKKSQDTKVFR